MEDGDEGAEGRKDKLDRDRELAPEDHQNQKQISGQLAGSQQKLQG